MGAWYPKQLNGQDSYAIPPKDDLDYAAFIHDRDYDKVGARGLCGVIFNSQTIEADERFIKSSKEILLDRESDFLERIGAAISIRLFIEAINIKKLYKIWH